MESSASRDLDWRRSNNAGTLQQTRLTSFPELAFTVNSVSNLEKFAGVSFLQAVPLSQR